MPSVCNGVIYEIQNECLKVCINSLGAELWSIRDRDGTEYLWQGNEKYWSNRAIQLFPYIGRLTDGKYSYRGREYSMDIHGFLKDSIMQVRERSESRIVFELLHTQNMREQYPFSFAIQIEYVVEGNILSVKYVVRNTDEQAIFFGIGGHPGFQVPLEPEYKFEDYYLEFGGVDELTKIEMTEDCFVQGEISTIKLDRGGRLKLRHEMFEDDAIIVKRSFRNVKLGRGEGKTVEVVCPDMEYMGIWHTPKTDAPYVCLEPWSSLPSRKGIVEDISLKKDLIRLEPKEKYTNQWEIRIGGIYDEEK